MQGIDPGGNCSILDLAQVGPPDPGHISKLSLRQAALFPQAAETTTEPDGKRDCHSHIVAVIVGSIVRFNEH